MEFMICYIWAILNILKRQKVWDILVVSVTSNKFVNKGVNRPYFDEKNGIALLNELSDVDYTVLSPDASAVKVIKNLKPNFYVKGPDYRIKENDKAKIWILKKKK